MPEGNNTISSGCNKDVLLYQNIYIYNFMLLKTESDTYTEFGI